MFLVILDSPPSKNLVNHPAIQTLSRMIGLQHTCGYITLLNPHLTTATGADVDDSTNMFIIGDSRSDDLLQLEEETMLGNGHEISNDAQINDGETRNFEDWVLLDMHFGLPLFDAQLNQEICEKV